MTVDHRTGRPRRARNEAPPHGTRARYQHPLYRCRCDACRAENAAYYRLRRQGIAYVPPDSALIPEIP